MKGLRNISASYLIGLSLMPMAAFARGSQYIPGSNVTGATGLLLSETAETAETGAASVSGHLLIGSDDHFDIFQVPVGVNYGIAPNWEVFGNLPYVSIDLDLPAGAPPGLDDSLSGLGNLTLGGKYRIPGTNSLPVDFAVGGSLAYGPLSSDLGDDGIDVNLKGMATRVLTDLDLPILLNGSVGILLVDGRGGDSDTVIQVNAGTGIPITPALTGIVELGLNQFGDDNGLLAFGLRGAANMSLQYQVLIGLGVGNDAPDTTLGGGVTYRFR